MTSLPRLRWGVIGAARIARSALVPALRAAGQDVVSVAARDPKRAAEFAAKFGMSSHASYDALLADPNIDAIYVALTNDAHLKWTVAALDAGKHVLCEKPLALTAAEVEIMRAAEARSGKLLMEAFCHIFHPRFPDIVELVRSGGLGELVTIEVSFTNPLPDPTDYRNRRALGGGAAYDLMGYCSTLATLVAGRQPQSVVARETIAGEVDSAIAATLDFGGCLAVLQSSFIGTRQQRMALIGTRDWVVLDYPIGNMNRDVSLTHGGTARTYPHVNPYQLMVEDFVRAVSGAAPLYFPSSASLEQARLMDRMKRAAAEVIAT
ncbi:MAG: Gfo/Idh/MocA family protein [Devosia sp.]